MNIPTITARKWELYQQGIRRSIAFLNLNKLPIPRFFTYEEAQRQSEDSFTGDRLAFRMWKRLSGGPIQGTGTGWYKNGTLFVNLKKAANPVEHPAHRSWSFPCYKTDRTPMGVVAHEVGHHVDAFNVSFPYGRFPSDTSEWRQQVLPGSNPITSYEPKPSEAFAETMRLFILNPQLLQLGSPRRYKFLTFGLGLKPSENRSWWDILEQRPDYCKAAEKWIAKAK